MISNLIKILEEITSQSETEKYLFEQILGIVKEHRTKIFDHNFPFIQMLSTAEEYSVSGVTHAYEFAEDGSVSTVGSFAEVHETNKVENHNNVKDYRLRDIVFANFKKFPEHGNSPFGLKLSDLNSHPRSIVLFSNNGGGKSSIYSALYYLLLDTKSYSGECVVHAKGDKQPTLAANLTNGIITTNGEDSENIEEGVRSLLPAFFCSENDISKTYINGESNQDEFIYNHLGYGEALKFLNLINRILEQDCDETSNHDEQMSDSDKKSKLSELKNEQHRIFDGIKTFFTELKDYKAENIKQIRDSISALHSKITFSYNKDTDRVGNFLSNTTRVQELNKEASAIIGQLDKEKETLKAILPNSQHYSEFYDEITNIFKATILDEHQGKHPSRMSDSYLALDAINLQFIEDGFEYYKQRVIDIIGISNDSQKQCEWISEQAVRAIKLSQEIDIFEKIKQDATENEKLSKIRSDLFKFRDTYREKMYQCMDETINPFLETFRTLMNDFCTDNDTLEVNYSNGHLDIHYLFESELNHDKIHFTPYEYLNSFRLKMFGLSLRISLAIAVMKEMKIDFPLVLDDVFYANDFNNRENVRNYISKIFECYNNQCPDLPDLQIIFLTHDDVVFESVYSAITKYQPCGQGLLFDHREVEESDLIKSKALNTSYYQLYVNK